MFTTMEKLAMQQTTQYGSTLKFGEYVIFTDKCNRKYNCKWKYYI